MIFSIPTLIIILLAILLGYLVYRDAKKKEKEHPALRGAIVTILTFLLTPVILLVLILIIALLALIIFILLMLI
ncbi:hypothetical protein [Methanonatronarchaeum sp. AMET6-2]|uniref:hypothetical protein n=1 Tax=Methanonatronarchaeum sp. AMET6-2 TaxID=2933293 RepID=UPI001212C338|nr:hypothetical protein [Methanonatronarchaeum sp. AMET6-2]RZN62137.1 MAG: hypothetical protein EF811_03550 [Methanonatronarchaeia archaeon]UOY09654.1 hypothetical protein MU439_05200 [Methanonatronarchaeum sp. AMET6-2]